jgi:hypothetical protein
MGFDSRDREKLSRPVAKRIGGTHTADGENNGAFLVHFCICNGYFLRSKPTLRETVMKEISTY